MGAFRNCIGHLPTKMVVSAEVACAIQTMVNLNGLNVVFILETVSQVSDDRLLGASGYNLNSLTYDNLDFLHEVSNVVSG